MKYTYFVSYSHSQGFGMLEIFRDTQVKTFDDVIALSEAIKNHNGLDVVILNWKELEGRMES